MTTAGVAMSRMETADDYFRVIARLNPRWRVIECRHGIQWILQRRGSPERARRDDWRGRSYCRTREALIRCTREYCGAIDPAAAAVLAGLPTEVRHAASGYAETPSRKGIRILRPGDGG